MRLFSAGKKGGSTVSRGGNGISQMETTNILHMPELFTIPRKQSQRTIKPNSQSWDSFIEPRVSHLEYTLFCFNSSYASSTSRMLPFSCYFYFLSAYHHVSTSHLSNFLEDEKEREIY